MMLTVDAAGALRDLKGRLHAIATALVARDGQLLCAAADDRFAGETFGVLCATVLGAAATAHAELHRASPERVVIEGPESTLVLVEAGAKALLATVLEPATELGAALTEIATFAELLRNA